MEQGNSRKSSFGLSILIIMLAVIFWGGYFILGLFIVQPIGAVPEGATVVYVRSGTALPFVASADGLLLEQTGGVSLLGRGIVLGHMGQLIADRKVMVFPYSQFLYEMSTGGIVFDR